MNTTDLINKLDKEFRIAKCGENLVEFAVSPENQRFVNPAFLKRQTGLMFKASENIEKLIKSKHSLYVAHAPLDTHEKYGTSVALAKICGISVEKLFFDYFGAPTASIGSIQRMNFDIFTCSVRKNLCRPILTLQKHRDYVEKIGVVAGGGDMAEILQEVDNNNCDTLLTGTVEHRWNLPFIQEGNRKFHELNKKLKINLVGGTHYGTERPAMISINRLFKEIGIKSGFVEDEKLLMAE